ncbi:MULTISPECIES: hypothetical protein [unclassified Synechococcus]|nr:hypothetical protein [Synechococcus sp. JA-2-3B'a(2-13)]ABD03579.1 hypothetical protein CYB_2653 [Synechococcus sp. JA-2-3B'a(2-13)]
MDFAVSGLENGSSFFGQGSLSKVEVKIGSKALPYRYAVRPGGL